MLYVLYDKYYEEGYYLHNTLVCGFVDGGKAKLVEYTLAKYFRDNLDNMENPSDYFKILNDNKENIIKEFSKVMSEKDSKKLVESLGFDRFVREWCNDWKKDGPWFRARELTEY